MWGHVLRARVGLLTVMLLGSACGGSTEVATEGTAEQESSSLIDSSTTSTASTAGDTTVGITPTTVANGSTWESIPVDPELAASQGDRAGQSFSDFAPDATIWLPSRLPAWLQGASVLFIPIPNNPHPAYVVNATIPYAEESASGLGSDVALYFSASLVESPEMKGSPIEGQARVYVTPEEYTTTHGPCGDVGVLEWYEQGWHFQVLLTPGPGDCSKGMQSVQDAVNFADALVPCKVEAGKLGC